MERIKDALEIVTMAVSIPAAVVTLAVGVYRLCEIRDLMVKEHNRR